MNAVEFCSGRLDGDVRIVSSVVRYGNTRTDSPQNRYTSIRVK